MWVDYGLAGCAALCILLGILFFLMNSSEIPVSDKPAPKTTLPKSAFSMPKEAYDAIGEPFLSMKFLPMYLQLPDLKKFLVYYGKNGRPDATADRTLMHFAFSGNKTVSSAAPGERLYILYDRKLNPPQYVFSPGNAETSLWIEPSTQGNEAVVNVSMRGEQGEAIKEPENNARFALPEKEYVRYGGTTWEIGKNRVDATLLARQRARWYGPDQFLAQHGGKEYAEQIGKQRIDFGEGEEAYSVFVGTNDALVWSNDRWQSVKPGPDSLGKPMLLVKKVDERLMNLELWDPEGKGKVLLNLLKSTEPAQPATALNAFKFVGARTRSQFVFEINKERVLLSPKDWMLLTPTGWIKLTTPKEIDDYVDRKTPGTMFVFDEAERKDDRIIMKGTLYNPSRTEAQSVEIPLQQPGQGAAKSEERSTTGKGSGPHAKQPPASHRRASEPAKEQVPDENLDDDDLGED